MICVHCEKPFEQKRKWQRYCSDKCRNARYIERLNPQVGIDVSCAEFGDFASLAAAMQSKHGEIMERAVPVAAWPIGPGIYFLIKGDSVVYVGKSTSLASRIGNHCADRVRGEKDFDSFSWIQCEAADLDLMERTFLCIYAATIAMDSWGNRSTRPGNALAGALIEVIK